MTFMNKILSYLGFCPSKESAQDFRVRNNTTTWIQKEYRDVIISGIVSGISVGVLFTIFLYLTQGEVPWASLFLYPIFFAIGHLISANLRERREAKKGEDVQRSE